MVLVVGRCQRSSVVGHIFLRSSQVHESHDTHWGRNPLAPSSEKCGQKFTETSGVLLRLTRAFRRHRRLARMKRMQILLPSVVLSFAVAALGQNTKSTTSAPQPQTAQPPATIASAVDREISGVEKQILDAAMAMPEDKFNFSPESLNIPGADYKGVRSFAVQVKHIAASNYFLWSGLTGDKTPGQPQGRQRSRGREDQGRDPQVPAGFLCPRP